MADAKPEAPPEWANYNPEFRPVDSLIPYARNARTHSPAQVKQIAASMVEFGVTWPALVDAKGIIAGHGRVHAATLLYEQGATLKAPSGRPIPTGTYPVMDATGWSAAQRKAYILADNQLAMTAGWDVDLLAIELEELSGEGFDLSLIGFDGDTLDEILGTGAGAEGEGAEAAKATLAEKFMLPPFSVLNAREGWWQDRKRAWIALGIESELGRGEGASPGGSPRPATDYSDGQRGDGRGRATGKRKADAIPGGGGRE